MAVRKQNILFVVLAYAFFWILLFAVLTLTAGNQELLMAILPYLQIVGTWAPTIALLVSFKKLYPGQTIKQFYKNAFKERLNFKLLFVFTSIFILVTLGFTAVASFQKGVSIPSLLNYSFGGFIVTLFSGATGEESGWRGYLQPSIEKRHSVLLSCFIVGIIWAFWHTPTWYFYVISGNYYMIPLDILSKISIAFIIGICYHRCRNLFVAMWMHFVLNLLINGIQGFILDYYVWYILVECLIAIAYSLWYIKSKTKESPSLAM